MKQDSTPLSISKSKKIEELDAKIMSLMLLQCANKDISKRTPYRSIKTASRKDEPRNDRFTSREREYNRSKKLFISQIAVA
jgi:hypothetical protein